MGASKSMDGPVALLDPRDLGRIDPHPLSGELLMKRFVTLFAALSVLIAGSALAGEGYGACEGEAQACLDHIAAEVANHGWMGVDGAPDAASGGFKITSVDKGSPAAMAGFKTDFVVTAVNGIEVDVNNKERMQEVMALMVADTKINFTVATGHGMHKDISVRLEAMPEEKIASRIGTHMMQHVTVVENASR